MWQTLHLQPAVIKVRDCVNMCVLLFVRVEPTDWTAMVEVRGGREGGSVTGRLLTIPTAIKLSLQHTYHTHTSLNTRTQRNTLGN